MKNKIFELFKEHSIYLVGGSVRDQLLGLETNDLDFAVSCVPEVTLDILQKAGYHTHTVGWAFGTVGIVSDEYDVHITTYRKNEDYQRDNRNPVVEWGATIQEDLNRRDFSINALAMDRGGAIIDMFNGIEHLKQKMLHTPIDASQAFADDPLRMLRAVRFKARLGFEYSADVKLGLKSQAHRLLILPRERILEEMNKILMTDNVAEALKDLYAFKLINYFIPELVVLGMIEQNNIYHSKNVWLHTVDVVKNTPKDIILRWAGLLHDVGKPQTISYTEGLADFGYGDIQKSKVHFLNHEEVGAMQAYSILHRLGLPKQWRKDITYLVRNHMRANTYEYEWSDTSVRRFIRDTGEYCDKLLALSRADITSHNPISIKVHLDKLNDLIRRIEELKDFKEVKSPLNGNAIMKYFNLDQVKQVGEIKEMVLNAVINGELKLGESEDVYLKWVEQKMEMKK